MANITRSGKSGLVLRNGVSRRKTTWFSAVFTVNTLASGSPIVLTSLNAAALALRPFTIVRTRGALLIASDQEAADEQQRVAYGEAVVSDEAVAVGTTAIPGPISESGSNLWYVYQALMGNFRFITGSGFVQNNQQIEIDSKAMRKVEVGQDIVQMAECTGPGADLIAFSKTLIKLH